MSEYQSSYYDKQMKWMMANRKKIEKQRKANEQEEERSSLSFQKSFEENIKHKKPTEILPSDNIMKCSTQHIERNLKAKKQKEKINQYFDHRELSKLEINPEPSPTFSSNQQSPYNNEQFHDDISDNMMIYDNYMQSSSNGFSHSHSHGHSQSMYPNNNNGQYNRFENLMNQIAEDDEDSEDDEPLIELFERERKKWAAEREKLIQCIHLQQIELNNRALSSHEKAIEIAKDFSSVIQIFEDRLSKIENNMSSDINNIKSSLKHLTNILSPQLDSNNNNINDISKGVFNLNLPTPNNKKE